MKNSHLIIPISIVVHLFIINAVLYSLTPVTYMHTGSVVTYNLSWLLIAVALDFYPTARKEKFFGKFHRFVQLFLLFSLSYFTVFAIRQYRFRLDHQLYILSLLFFFLLLYRILFFVARNKYRAMGGNSANVIVVGRDSNLKRLRKIFDEPELGYRYMGYFHDASSSSATYRGEIKQVYDFIQNNGVDEIYCLASQLSKEDLNKLIIFADNHLIKIKIIPDNKEIYTRAMQVELFENIPVLNLRQSALDTVYGMYLKRAFDILFSSLVLIFILSWLIPLMYILIKGESRGPLFFKQLRHGHNKKAFWCYKFRSMTVNTAANEIMASKNDARLTKVGKFIRKTSLDEFPQFINVFMGDMSVVGPRPHMEKHTLQYEKSVDKYLVRHFAKPGITGLAQVKGFRGEIVNPSDIINRTRLDIFYLEKWSMLLDLKIIASTVTNALAGEEKAY
ncbi:undecaprenyl-phosphate glucose phosphotransferase [Christiangramia fulva]|uniref:Undecaprenyl-phosphate glucose phosphotransferase n=1 Tax=Christiangramia fulva TaxID=2126553 RepID=A0A2R3Z4X3_9FLAO|nr:exopolysaccharide biosynthesis polyprenyl glycosylphosphotransferase [Christiangramia fulva]AVR45284.1 undecaprenyl-phosphate glucose phosphotransferase [Christiangramia fulva]